MIKLIDKLAIPLTILTALTFIASLVMIFFYAPVEMTMGISQKIFYVHVPSAFAA